MVFLSTNWLRIIWENFELFSGGFILLISLVVACVSSEGPFFKWRIRLLVRKAVAMRSAPMKHGFDGKEKFRLAVLSRLKKAVNEGRTSDVISETDFPWISPDSMIVVFRQMGDDVRIERYESKGRSRFLVSILDAVLEREGKKQRGQGHSWQDCVKTDVIAHGRGGHGNPRDGVIHSVVNQGDGKSVIGGDHMVKPITTSPLVIHQGVNGSELKSAGLDEKKSFRSENIVFQKEGGVLVGRKVGHLSVFDGGKLENKK